MTQQSHPEENVAGELGQIIRRMKEIQSQIAASGQPVSGLEVEELSRLGQRYGEIVQSLADTCGES